MRFEHSLSVSDPERGFLPSPGEVWSALFRRVEDPCTFNPGVTSFRIIEREPRRLMRELRFGQTSVLDVVTFDEKSGWLRFEVAETASHAGGALTITVSEDDASVKLRFSYGTTLQPDEDATGLAPDEYVKAAYAASDRDTVDAIRDLLGYRA